MSAPKRRAPSFVFSGTIAPVTGKWVAIYFETHKSGVDWDTIATLPVACWAACVRGKDHIVGGMVANVSGLELAELDADFRGYLREDTDEEREAFVNVWSQENGFGESEEEDPEDDPDDEEE